MQDFNHDGKEDGADYYFYSTELSDGDEKKPKSCKTGYSRGTGRSGIPWIGAACIVYLFLLISGFFEVTGFSSILALFAIIVAVFDIVP